MKKLYRSKDSMLFGVCAGLAEYLNVDKTLVRVIFTAAVLLSGIFPFLALYILCLFIIPMAE